MKRCTIYCTLRFEKVYIKIVILQSTDNEDHRMHNLREREEKDAQKLILTKYQRKKRRFYINCFPSKAILDELKLKFE